MTNFQLQLDRIRRRIWLVVGITLLATIAAFASVAGKATTYTGKSTIEYQTDNSSPDQRAVAARGIIENLNKPEYQKQIKRELRAKVPGEFGFSAAPLALSAFIEVRATSKDEGSVPRAASEFAKAVVAQRASELSVVGESKRKEFNTQIKDLNAQITARKALVGVVNAPTDENLNSLRTQVGELTRLSIAPNAGQWTLAVGQDAPGVAINGAGKVRTLILALIGGLILGTAVALLLGTVDGRLATPGDVRERLGLETLATITGGSSAVARRLRERDLKTLANVVALSGLPKPATIAVTSAGPEDGKGTVAGGLAAFRALQGERVTLMRADLHERGELDDGSDELRRGVADYLATKRPVSVDQLLVPSGRANLEVIPPGRAPGDPYALFARERFGALVEQAAGLADLLVIDAPPLREAAESQVICQTADRTILVVNAGVTQAADVAEATMLLEQVGASVLGVVLVGASAPGNRRPMLRRLVAQFGRSGEAPSRPVNEAEVPEPGIGLSSEG